MAKDGVKTLKVRRADRMGWMTTFSDMVTLLLTFFVMIIAMSSLDSKALKDMLGYFSSASGALEFPSRTGIDLKQRIVDRPQAIEPSAMKLREAIAEALKAREPDAKGRGMDLVDVEENPRGLMVRMGSDVLFSGGSSTLRDEARPVLTAMAGVLKDSAGTISVEGHTDSTGDEKGNWYLSIARAMRVVDFFVYEAGMKPSRFCVAGYGMRKPVATNDTEGGRQKNRRVEIVVLRDRF
jgi:chemotaxis protein MotB